MKEQYYKVKKVIAARAGLTDKLREEVDEDFLLLSEKDIRNISLTFEEKLHAIDACPLCEDGGHQDEEKESEIEEVEEEENDEIEEDTTIDEEEFEDDSDLENDEESQTEDDVEPEITEEDEH